MLLEVGLHFHSAEVLVVEEDWLAAAWLDSCSSRHLIRRFRASISDGEGSLLLRVEAAVELLLLTFWIEDGWKGLDAWLSVMGDKDVLV